MAFTSPRRVALFTLFPATLTALAVWQSAGRTADGKPDPAAVERTRNTIKMLDDLHKGYVVHITDTYVKAQTTTPAARITKKVFKHMADQGWGAGRLVDATGVPANEANLPKTEFDKRAVARIKAGAAYYDEIGAEGGKPVLRAGTVVPVVMEQCISCHPGFKKGDVLGALIYELPIR